MSSSRELADNASAPEYGGQGRVEVIQIIRAVAALLVALTHGIGEANKISSVPYQTLLHFCVDRGQFGVDLFFVVSGFIMTHISYVRLNEPTYAQDFLIRRIARVVPVYWFYLSLMIVVTLISPSLRNRGDLDIVYIISSYMFIPFPRPGDGAPEPFLGLGWTLNYEMYFYVSFFVFMLLFKTKSLRACLIYFVSAFFIGQVVRPQNIALSTWTNSVLFEFCYGIMIALAFRRRYHLGGTAAVTLFGIGIILWLGIGLGPDMSLLPDFKFALSALRGFLWGIPAALIVASLTLGTSRMSMRQHPGLRSLVKLGDASYSLYLVHLFVMRLLTLMFHPAIVVLGILYPVAYVGTFVAATIGASFMSYHLLERPAERAWIIGLRRLLGSQYMLNPVERRIRHSGQRES